MKVKELKEFLNIFHDEIDVYVQTVPNDFASPLDARKFSIIPASLDEAGGQIIGINQAKVLITAHHPYKEGTER